MKKYVSKGLCSRSHKSKPLLKQGAILFPKSERRACSKVYQTSPDEIRRANDTHNQTP